MKGRTTKKRRPAFGQRLATSRVAQGLTQAMLAAKIGIDRSTVRHYERNVVDPKLGFVLLCCSALRIPLEALVGPVARFEPRESRQMRQFKQSLFRLSPRKQRFALRLFARQLVEITQEGGK